MSEVSRRDAKGRTITKHGAKIRAKCATAEMSHVLVWKDDLCKLWAEYEVLHEAVMQRTGDAELELQGQFYDGIYDVYSDARVELQQIEQLLRKRDAPVEANVLQNLESQHNFAILRILDECERFLDDDRQLAVLEMDRAESTINDMMAHMRQKGADCVAEGARAADIVAAEAKAGSIVQRVRTKLGELLLHHDKVQQAQTMAAATANAEAIARAAVVAANAGGAANAEANQAFKKPTFTITPFDGSFDKWESFRDSFEYGINRRPGLSNVEKLNALKGLLRGGPELLVRNLSLTDANYVTAWASIQRRYSHRRELLFSHYRVLHELPTCAGNVEDLTSISNQVISTLGAIANMDEPIDQLDSWVVFLVCEKLDKMSRSLWEQHIAANDDVPSWDDLDLFLQGRIRALSAASNNTGAKGKRVFSHAVKEKQVADRNESHNMCTFCNECHLISFCVEFRRLSISERRNAIAAKGLCFVCMGDGHKAAECSSQRRCNECGLRHNTMLHTQISSPAVPANAVTAESTSTEQQQVVAHTASHVAVDVCRSTYVVLATAVIQVRDVSGALHELRALLDQGSEASFISERAVQLLQLQRSHERSEIVGLGGVAAGRARQSVNLRMCDRFGNGFETAVRALVIPKISERASVTTVRPERMWAHMADMQLADPDALGGVRIDVLLGSDIYGTLLRDGLKQRDGVPTAQYTWLGWVLSGKIDSPMQERVVQTHHLAIDEQLAKFWELEETSVIRPMSDENAKCERYFDMTVSRDASGRLHVRLPLKVDDVVFGETQRFAVQRQLQIERKFKAYAKFAEMYKAFMEEYEALGHMRKVVGADVDMSRTRAMQTPQKSTYYIPHHAVIKDSSTTTKLRVVFDASRQSTNGVSLNNVMLKGPRLQEDITTIMMRWRKYRVAYCADIQRMYRQIVVDQPDTAMQRIVWRSSTDEPMEVYELTTVTYGTASAPYLAVKSLLTLAELERERFPVGATIAKQNFYVDDVLCGADDDSQSILGQREIIGLLASGGMSLRKWASNSDAVLAQVDADHRECQLPLDIHDDAVIGTLGVQWHPSVDQLGFKVNIAGEANGWTKRSFLSAASRLYDPLGWISPCIVRVKMLFQSLWKLKLEWDDPLPVDVARQWDELRMQLHRVDEVRINRWIGATQGSEIELHGFSDASLDAYAAVVFARIRGVDGVVHVHNICAKSKVAPVKVVSLPRLELCGASLLVKLLTDVRKAMMWEAVTVRCWTDSTIVLAWLNGHSSQFTVFVANRTAEIQRSVAADQWRHVPSGENPADCASRGISVDQLLTHSLWWTGPQWLFQGEGKWPAQPIVAAATDEVRMRANHVVCTTNDIDLISRCSSLRRLVRATAWCLRFAQNCRTNDRSMRQTGPLEPVEHQEACKLWVREAQKTAFAAELRDVLDGKAVSKSSSLRALNPTMSSDGILLVGGRLLNARELSKAARMPAIIPRRCDLSRLLVKDAHDATLHGGPMLMLAHLRRKYWVIDGPNEVRHYVQKCTTCYRHKASPTSQIMGALPAARVVPSRPFSNSALDYSGAILVRTTKGRGHHSTKAYVAVFVCLATKAVHIELASDLTTAAFIAAYERFTARRGVCTALYSDNANNFVGAATIFLRSERELFDKEVLTALATRGTKWHFSPPLSPHFNGLAESAIRSVKHHLKRVVGESTLTFEELTTVLAKIEAVLNSRPIYALSSDPSDYDALTPAHFLIGEQTGLIAQTDHADERIPLSRRWELTQQMVQRFWRRWSTDYLHTLQQRHKWQRPEENLRVDDLVLMLDDNLPPGKWALGRVLEVHPGDDGRVRVATVRTRGGSFKRAVVRLAKLPNQDEPSGQTA